MYKMQLFIINTVLYFLAITWAILYDKHVCKCSNDWKKMYMRIWMIFMILCLQYIEYFIIIGQIIFIIVAFVYLNDVIKSKCKCLDTDYANFGHELTIYFDIFLIFIAISFYWCSKNTC